MSMKNVVHLASPTSQFNCSWDEATKFFKYLKRLNIDVLNVKAVSTQGVKYEKEWVMENGWTPSDSINILCDTSSPYNQTVVCNHTVAELIAKFEAGEKWAFERLMESHGIIGKDLAQFYLGFENVQKAVASLF